MLVICGPRFFVQIHEVVVVLFACLLNEVLVIIFAVFLSDFLLLALIVASSFSNPVLFCKFANFS